MRHKGIFHNKAFVVEAQGEKKRVIGLTIANGGGIVCSYSKINNLTSKGFKVCHFITSLCLYLLMIKRGSWLHITLYSRNHHPRLRRWRDSVSNISWWPYVVSTLTMLLPTGVGMSFPSLSLYVHLSKISCTQHHAAPRSTTQHHAAPRSITQHHSITSTIWMQSRTTQHIPATLLTQYAIRSQYHNKTNHNTMFKSFHLHSGH